MSFSLSSLAPSPALLRERCNALSCVCGRTLTLEEAAETAAKRLRLSSDEACAYLIRAVRTLFPALHAALGSGSPSGMFAVEKFRPSALLTGFFPCHSRQFLL